MVFHWTNLPEQQQGSEAGSCLSAAAEELQCAASSAVVELHTFAEGTEQLSWGGDAMPVELPVQHVGLSHCRQRSVVAAFEKRKW